MMKIKLLFFATYKEITHAGSADFEIEPNTSVSQLKTLLAQRWPALAAHLPNALVSVNQAYAFNEDLVPDGAEVAFFPPVSGGSTPTVIYKVTHDPLDLNELTAAITTPATGAVCSFSGMVRGVTKRGDAHDTVALEYEAYVPMAEAKMAQVAGEIHERWPSVDGIVIVQRIGRLEPQTPTVFIACSAAHRDTGVFEAARYGIDRLKEIVPIWKKEIGPHGEIWVEGHYHPRPGE